MKTFPHLKATYLNAYLRQIDLLISYSCTVSFFIIVATYSLHCEWLLLICSPCQTKTPGYLPRGALQPNCIRHTLLLSSKNIPSVLKTDQEMC